MRYRDEMLHGSALDTRTGKRTRRVLFRRLRRLYLALVLGGGVIFLLWAVLLAEHLATSSPPTVRVRVGGVDVSDTPGCLFIYAAKNVYVNEPTFIDTTASVNRCVVEDDFPIIPEPVPLAGEEEEFEEWFSIANDPDTLQQSRAVWLGLETEVKLVSPTFPGEVYDISDSRQGFRQMQGAPTWSWELRANKPGIHKLSLIVSVVSDDGEIIYQNKRYEIELNTRPTVAYYVGAAASGIASFLTSLQGLVIGLIAAVGAGYTLYTRVKKGQADEDSKGSSGDSEGADSSVDGYL